jgi:hypothetical protein
MLGSLHEIACAITQTGECTCGKQPGKVANPTRGLGEGIRIKAPYSKDNPWWEDETYRCRCLGCTGPSTCRCCIGCGRDTYEEYSF